MKFKTRRDPFLTTLVIGLYLVLAAAGMTTYLEEGFTNDVIILNIVTVLLLIFFAGALNTSYEITKTHLKYRFGFVFSGKIEISRIREIVKGKTMRVGFKPAAASKGLIIKYDKYEELYISPKTNDSFIEEILKIKDDIVITQ